ncbi:MAG TPA: PAS domain S-box protein, partial [Nitrospiraceae bacterium]|nr:PAS domain S-box protein [Nitrospiraceae bacterium]
CLAGRNGEMLDLDYRDRQVVHGFRFIEEIGGGCIMAHIQQAEAFAPARTLARQLLAVSGGFLLIGIGSALFFGRLLSKPIDRLTDRVRTLERGDFSSPVPVEGPLEIQAFAKTFEAMAHSLSLSRHALVESEARTRAIVEHTLNAVVTINADGIITDWNRQAEIQFGWSKAEAMGQSMAALIIPPSYRDAHAAGLQRFLQTGEGRILDRQVELTALRRNGEEFPVELAVTAIRMGTSYLFTAFIFDITERKRAEEGLREKQEQLVQAAKLASIGELATGVAHELNNPLNNINLFVGNIQDRMRLGIMATETLAKDLERVSQQVQKAAAIVDHLRTFGRGAPVTREPVSINDVLTSALSLVREQFRLREIDVALELAPSAPTVLGNAIQLEQVFVNLLGNAHDSVAELPTKTVTVRSIAHSDLVEVTVQDTGMGMSQEVQRRLFDPFFTTKPVGRGTGLGLSIAYGIIQDHQGVIDVDSAPGHGATFTIHLPLLQND